MSDVRDTAPADSTKPGACGSGGGPECEENWGGSLTAWIECRGCGCRGPSETIPGGTSRTEAVAIATRRWNRMWMPRVGEATKHLAKVVADHQRSKVGRIGSHFMVVMTDEVADAALAELGLAGGEGRG